MIEVDLRTMAQVVSGDLVEATGKERIRGVGIDTREDLSGRCFVAIRGDRHDGHDHLAAAFTAGTSSFADGVRRVGRGRLPFLVLNAGLPLRRPFVGGIPSVSL